MINKKPTITDVRRVLNLCGPRRISNAAKLPINKAASRWMQGLLSEPKGALAIAYAIMSVWYASELGMKKVRR